MEKGLSSSIDRTVLAQWNTRKGWVLTIAFTVFLVPLKDGEGSKELLFRQTGLFSVKGGERQTAGTLLNEPP